MPADRVIASLAAAALLILVGGETASHARGGPSRSLAAPARVLTLGLTGRHVAFAVGTTARECPRVGLWLTESNARFRFPTTLLGCKDGPSTGFGIPSVAVARTRVLWLTYIGGNKRDWQLWTATPTGREPRQLRFVERDVDDAAPVVLGPGTIEGVPYAVDREIVYLGDNGRAIFRTTARSPVQALAADQHGPSGVSVAALLSGGHVIGLDRNGSVEVAMDVPESASAIGLDERIGIAVQVGREVTFADGSVRLPVRARMVDVAQGRVLWVRSGDLGTTTLTGTQASLVDGTNAKPADGRLEALGLAWSRGSALHWRAGRLP